MADIQIDKENKFNNLKENDREELAQKIGSWFEDFHQKRNKQLQSAKKIADLIFLNQPDRNKEKDDTWKANIKENRVYTTYDSMKAAMWKEIWSNEEQMFDVVGKSKEDDETAETQKKAIVHSLKQMNAGVQYDKATNNWFCYGDFIFKTDWKKRTKLVRRPDLTSKNGFCDIELPVYDNANIEAIDPLFFVWDVTTLKIDDQESWDKCIKIYKRFESLENIKNNPQYKLAKKQYEELKNRNETTQPVDKLSDTQQAENISYGDLHEVLYLHGNFKFKGINYQNAVAEVIGRKYLIFFNENPVFINPFIWGAVDIDPETKRGISPLKPIIELSQYKEELVNKLADAAALTMNPPYIADELAVPEKYKNKDIKLSPGKFIEFNNYTDKAPTQISVNPSGIKDIAGYLDNVISDVSSVNSNLMGNINSKDRKATELNLAQSGATSRIALRLDKIYQINLIVIENVAELLAMFKNQSELILVKESGIKKEIEITNTIRQANYSYYYEDRNALVDRRAKVQEAITMLNGAGQNPELSQKIDWEEALKTGLEMIGFDNPDKFFKDETPLDNLFSNLKRLAPQQQEAFVQAIQPIIIQMQGLQEGETV